MEVVVVRSEVWLVRLDPVEGHEMRKTRPYLVVSPDEMNRHVATVIIAPMTTMVKDYPMRVGVRFRGKTGQVVLDQLRTVDKAWLVRKMGRLDPAAARSVLAVLAEMFAS